MNRYEINNILDIDQSIKFDDASFLITSEVNEYDITEEFIDKLEQLVKDLVNYDKEIEIRVVNLKPYNAILDKSKYFVKKVTCMNFIPNHNALGKY